MADCIASCSQCEFGVVQSGQFHQEKGKAMMLDYFPTDIDYSARVAKGIELLDEKFPDWWKRMDLDTLDVANGMACVTAQSAQLLEVGDDWLDGMYYFGLNNDSHSDKNNTYIAHGFNAEDVPWMDGDVQEGWENYSNTETLDRLTNMWRLVILERRSALSITL